MLNALSYWLQKVIGLNPDIQGRLLATLATILGVWGLQRIVLRIALGRTTDLALRYRWRRVSGYVAAGVGFLLVGLIWFEDFTSLATYLGIVSAGLAIALQSVVLDLAGWGLIVSRRLFEVGDRIELAGYKGDVVDLRLFQVSLLEVGNWVQAEQSTGRIVHIPTSAVLSQPLANYTRSFRYIWIELPVLLTFESNWEQAKRLLQEIAGRHGADIRNATELMAQANKDLLIRYSRLTPVVYTAVRPNGIELTIRCLCEPRQRRDAEQAIWEEILRELAAHPDMLLACPPQRNYREASPMSIERAPGSTDSASYDRQA